MQKRKRYPYPHTRRFAIALILTMGFMLYLITYNPYPIIAIPPYFELLPFIYVPLTLWWLPVGWRYLRRFQIQKHVVLLMMGGLLMSFALSTHYLTSHVHHNLECKKSSTGYSCIYRFLDSSCTTKVEISTFENFAAGIHFGTLRPIGACTLAFPLF